MSFSINGKSKDQNKLIKKIHDEKYCPDAVKAIAHDAVTIFPNGTTLELSMSGHFNEDGSGNFTINVAGSEVPKPESAEPSGNVVEKSLGESDAGKDALA